MKLAIVSTLLLATSISHADPTFDLTPPSRHFRPATTIDFGPPVRGPTRPQPPDQPVPPPPLSDTGSVGFLGGVVGVVVLPYLVLKMWSTKDGGGARNVWRSQRMPKRSTGYTALLPDIRKLREVSVAPTVTTESVQGGLSLRW